MVWFASPG
jgi:hypothetical protein